MDGRGVKVRRGQKEKIAVVVLTTACLSVCWFDFGFGYKVRSIKCGGVFSLGKTIDNTSSGTYHPSSQQLSGSARWD